MRSSAVPLGELVNVQTGKLDANASSENGQYPFFTCAREPLKIDRWRFDLDAVLVAGNGDLNVKHYCGKFEAYQRTYVLSVKDLRQLDTRYLFHFMDTYLDVLRAQSIGGIIKYIKLGMLTDALMPLPPLEEQKRIAAILDQADALRRLRARALDRLNALGQATFHEMFGSPLTTNGTNLLNVLIASGNGLQVEQSDKPEGHPVSRIETIWNGTIDPNRIKWCATLPIGYERYLLNEGDILFSHINSPEHIAKTAIYRGVPFNLLHGINLLRLQPDRSLVEPSWLLTLLKSAPVRDFFRARCKKAVNQASLNKGNLAEMTFSLPPMRDQQRFAERLRGVELIDKQLAKSAESFESLFGTLQHRAFRGEL